jgi:branched-chain amino acid transport system substrate-binding protein
VQRSMTHGIRNTQHATRNTWYVVRGAWYVVRGACCVALLGACVFPGSVPTTVKIGLSAPFEGLYRDLGYEVLSAVRLAVRQRNEAGGVGGRYLVEMVALNDFNEAEESIQQAREMAADPGVLGVLGGWSPQTAQAAALEYERLGIAFLAPGTDWSVLAGEAVRAADGGQGVGDAAVLYTPDAANRALAEAFGAAVVAQGGSVVGMETPAGDDWAPGLVQRDSPDAVFVAADVLTAARWVAALREAGFGGAIIGGPQLGSPLLVDVAGEAGEGVIFASPYPPLPDDPEFVTAYQEISGGAPPGPVAGWAYTAATHLLDAMTSAAAENQAHPTRSAVQQALLATPFGPPHAYLYIIQPGNLFTPYYPLPADS